MKYQDMDVSQKDAFRELCMLFVERRIREDVEFTNQFFRLLVLGNGAGIAILATFMGAIAGKGHTVALLVAPLWKFFLGSVFAASIYFPLMLVAIQATIVVSNQIIEFFQNQRDSAEITGYGLNRFGKFVVFTLAFLSLVMFITGVHQCISILSKS